MAYNSLTNSLDYGSITLNELADLQTIGTNGQTLTATTAGTIIWSTPVVSGGTVTSVGSADLSITITNPTTTPDLAFNTTKAYSFSGLNTFTKDVTLNDSLILDSSSATNYIQLSNPTTGVLSTDGTLIYQTGNDLIINNQEASQVTVQLASTDRINLNNTNSTLLSPSGTTKSTISDSDIVEQVAGIVRIRANATDSTIFSPDGTSAKTEITNSTINSTLASVLRNRINSSNCEILSPNGSRSFLINDSNSIIVYEGAQPRIQVDATNTSLLSPDGTNTVIVNDSSITVNNGAFVVTVPIAATDTLVGKATVDTLTNKSLTNSSDSDLTTFNQSQFHNASTFPTFTGGCSNNTLLASKHTSGVNISGSDNTVVGAGLTNLTSGADNVCIGRGAGNSITSSSDNILIGLAAGQTIATGNGSNIGIGVLALSGTGSTVTENVAVGESSGAAVSSNNNTFLGHNSGINMTSGASNTFVGHNSGNISNGTSILSSTCTLVGKDSNLTSGTTFTNASALGYQATVAASNQIVLGNSSVTSIIPGGNSVAALGGSSNKFTTVYTPSVTNTGTISFPTSTDTLVALATTDSLTNKTATSNTNNVIARELWIGSGSGSVSTYAATAPTTGQVLTATSSTTATWQAAGGGNSWSAAAKAAFLNLQVNNNYSNFANTLTAYTTEIVSNGKGKIIWPVGTGGIYSLSYSNQILSQLEIAASGTNIANFFKGVTKNNIIYNTGLNDWISTNPTNTSGQIGYVTDANILAGAWTVANTNSEAGWGPLAYSPSLARTVACKYTGTSTAVYSWADDSAIGTWTSGTGITTLNQGNVIWCNSISMFISYSTAATGLINYSTDGKVWTQAGNQPSIGVNTITGIAWSSSLGIGVITVNATTSNLVSFTVSGTTFTWTARTPSITSIELMDVVFCTDILQAGNGPECFMAVTKSTGATTKNMMSSADGITWQTIPSYSQASRYYFRLGYANEYKLLIGVRDNLSNFSYGLYTASL